ncbi:MAG TPA: heparinase II/III-family protein, partial [Polyangiaceae bacterium]|nr:heparinase II/III-family protein [Polyangiaceae bacterium]
PQRFRGYNAEAFGDYAERSTPLARQLVMQWAPDEGGERWPDAEDLVVFEDSGFVVMHGGPRQGAEQTHLVFNTAAPYHGHSHADAFALHLYGPDADAPGAGWPLLVDSGWYSYRNEGRHYFESTRAHNTVAVDGRNQCTRAPSGKREAPEVDRPLWSCLELGEAARASGTDVDAGAGVGPGEAVRGLTARGDASGQAWSYQSAQHRLYLGVTHRRAVVLAGGSLVLVLDALDGDAAHDFAQSWHLAPELGLEAPPEPGGDTLHFRFAREGAEANTQLSLHAWNGGEPLAVALERGNPGSGGVPGPGWYSRAENQREPAQVVELHRGGQSEAVFASVFLLGPLAARSAEVAVRVGDASERWVDVVLDDGSSWSLAVRALGAGAAAGESVEVLREGALP